MSDAKWSNNTIFPINNSLDGTELFPGLKDNDNFKTQLKDGIVNFVNSDAQLASIDQVTGLQAALDAIDLEFAYNNAPTYPYSAIDIPDDGEIAVTHQVGEDSEICVSISPAGITSTLGLHLVPSNNIEEINGIDTINSESAVWEVISTIRGSISAPVMTETQRDAIDVSNSPEGLQVFNSTTKTLDYYDDTNWQKTLNTQNLNGTGTVTVTDNGDGTVTIFGSGGGDLPEGAYGAYVVYNNGSSNAFTGVAGGYKTIPVGSGFTSGAESDFSSSIETIGGVSTPVSRYTGSTTQAFSVAITVAIQSNTAGFRHYSPTLSIVRQDGSIEQVARGGMLLLNNTTGPLSVTVPSEVVLNNGDGIFPQVYLTESDAGGFSPSIVSAISSIAGTVQYASGAAVVGNIPKFNTTWGQYVDSGIAYSSLALTSGDQTIGGVKTFSSNIIGNLTGNATTATSATTATNATNVGTTADSSTNSDFYLTFAPSSSSGNQALKINGSITYNPVSGVFTSPNLILSALSANQLIGLNSSKIAASIGAGTSTQVLHGNASGFPTWSALNLATDVTGTLSNGNTTATSANTASAIVARDSSGNFSAGTITADLSGNASTVTNGVYTTGSYADPAWITSLATSKLSGLVSFTNGGFNFNTATAGDLFYASATNTPGKLSAVASGRVLASAGVGVAPAYTATPTLSSLTLNNGNAALTGTNPALAFSSLISDGNYIRLGDAGKNVGNTSSGNVFISQNLDWNATSNDYRYATSAAGSAIELSTSGGSLKYAVSGTANNAATMLDALTWSSSNGAITVGSASNFTFTDAVTNLLTIRSLTGTPNTAGVYIERNSSATGSAEVRYGTGGSAKWRAGALAGNENYSIYDSTNGVTQFTMTQGSGTSSVGTFTGSIVAQDVTLNGQSASGVVTTDGSKVLTTITSPTSFTPTIGDGTNNFVTSQATGAYFRIGPLVVVNAQVIWTSKGSAVAGSALTLSLPVVNPSAASIACSIGYSSGIGYTGTSLLSYIFPGTSSAFLVGFSNTGTGTGVLVSNAATSGNLIYSAIYSAV